MKVAFSAGGLTDVRPSVVIIDASLSFTSRRHCGGHLPTLVYLSSPEGATIRRDAGVNLLLWAGGGLPVSSRMGGVDTLHMSIRETAESNSSSNATL